MKNLVRKNLLVQADGKIQSPQSSGDRDKKDKESRNKIIDQAKNCLHKVQKGSPCKLK